MNSRAKYDLFEWAGDQKSRWLLHLIFWSAVLVFYTFFFGYKNVNYKITFSFVIILLPVTIITTYFLNYELIPNYLFKKRYAEFFLYFIYTLIVSFYIEMATVMVIFIVVAELKMEELHPSNTNALFLIAGMYVVVFLGVAVKLVNQYHSSRLEIQKLNRDKMEAELKFLKTQLHPHFLFNTLNNLYSLTLEKSDRASDVVLKLSGLLDYILYECNAEMVALDKEIKQIGNYITLEKLRFEDRLEVDFGFHGSSPEVMIPPMLLMTLVENSFKHGVSRTMKRSWIRIELKVESDRLLFDIKNSRHNIMNSERELSGGIGLQNLRNRLQLIYKDDFKLEISNDERSYEVQLEIKTFSGS
ncbi:MAG: histidine kinase [Cytophagales bacterium]|nr:histidine kinase [Cytophagales bacterium]